MNTIREDAAERGSPVMHVLKSMDHKGGEIIGN